MKTAILFLLLAVAAVGDDSQLTVFGQQIMQYMVAGNFSAAEQNFDKTMQSKLPEDKLRAVWNSLVGQVGPFQRILSTKVQKISGYDAVDMSSQFQSASLTVRVVVNSSKQVAGLFFLPAATSTSEYETPSYVNPSSFKEKEVLFGTKEWMVHGTVTTPNGMGPFPAVVLVHGSGPQDRDETIGPNKPFRDLAWGLASQRIAVLRYEKRTMEYRGKAAAMSNITLKEETVDDAVSAVNILRNTEQIDPHRIFILGHSLGGMAAPWIGKVDPQIAGLVILAGTTRPLEDIILDQYTYLNSLGQIPAKDLEDMQQQVMRVKDPRLSAATPKAGLPFGIPAAYWLALKAYNPGETARKLTMPMFILQGERDYQATKADMQGWQAALYERKNVTYHLYADLNHLFMKGTGKAKPAEYEHPGHVADQVIRDIGGWILQWKN